VDERGGGPISIWVGFSVFLVMLLFAAQVLFNLYAASVVTAVSYDAARRVAGSDGGTSYMAEAEAKARVSLGRYERWVEFDWDGTTDEEVVLRVQADTPSLLPAATGLDRLDRTIRIRVERFR
jgi:hypothetical protein